ncbi:unnamed protein product [Schistosoma curassoni]|uniref:Secreted protein n=1 Tax=Schistosoma curassoni TaxID=6186 RepID=A0A183JWF2_9TREM|nr:unnamed protein product [Schistosoma curassoni]
MCVSSYLGFFSWMYLHPRLVDVHSRARTQYRSLQMPWLAVESRTRVLFYLGLVSWMYLHFRVDVHSGTRTQYRPLQMPSRYPLSY